MKIVLSNKEVKSFERFLGQYVLACKESLEAMDTEEAREELVDLEGKSVSELVKLMMDDMNIEPLVVVGCHDDNEMVLDVNSEILMAYNDYMTSSMKVLRPYACKLAKLYIKHEEAVSRAYNMDSSFWKKASGVLARTLVRFAKGILVPLGLTDLCNDVIDLYNEFKTDEYGFGAMKDLITCLEQKTYDTCMKK